jgi:hypothetical protein
MLSLLCYRFEAESLRLRESSGVCCTNKRGALIGNVSMCLARFKLESLILAQNERWRSALDMQVERESRLRVTSKVAHG